MTRNETYPSGRLIKVLLPSDLVAVMDGLIDSSSAYTDRSQFIVDAVHGHIAELQAQGFGGATAWVGDQGPAVAVRVTRRGSPNNPSSSVAAIPPISETTPTLATTTASQAEPTWGMHNRDFPTLWALWHLAEAAQTAGEPVVFAEWLGRVVADAWELARRLPGDQFDTAGFPSNAAKSDASEGRFVKFFIGDEQGTGPFFDLGLAGFERGRVAPTQAGLVLLRALEGFGCQRERELLSIWTESYLRHLANHAPADLAFMSAILRHIGNGQDERATLLEVVAGDYPSWTDSVTDTNVAGFIARAREWGLLLSRQRKGKYVLNPGAIVALDDASRA